MSTENEELKIDLKEDVSDACQSLSLQKSDNGINPEVDLSSVENSCKIPKTPLESTKNNITESVISTTGSNSDVNIEQNIVSTSEIKTDENLDSNKNVKDKLGKTKCRKRKRGPINEFLLDYKPNSSVQPENYFSKLLKMASQLFEPKNNNKRNL